VLLAQITDYYWALLCMTVAIAATGFHNNAIIVNPQDLAPKHSGSVFGLMNTVGAVPGKIIWLFYNKHLFLNSVFISCDLFPFS
jgi:ACS family sodium-dependent inorganic phosphate cotransporter-like MFS transporter 9